ncbi:MAG: LemA family protein [Cellvibrionaceae bacterium]
MSLLWRFMAGIAVIALMALAIFLGESAFNQVQNFRVLERIPLTSIVGSTEGEVQLKGEARAASKPLQSPKAKAGSVYYRYLVEKKYRDSEGRTSWRTVSDKSDAVDFVLSDLSGKTRIYSREASSHLQWSVEKKFYLQQGDYRYHEWRVDQGDSVTLFGWMKKPSGEEGVSFYQQGDYLPIVSSKNAVGVRGDMGWSAILFLALAITVLVFASFLLVVCLGIHRVLVLLVVVTLACTSFLWYYGWQSMKSDITGGYARFETQRERSDALISEILKNQQYSFSSGQVLDMENQDFQLISQYEKDKINAWRVTAYLVRQRYLQQISRFPENYYAKLTKLNNPVEIPLSSEQRSIVEVESKNYEITRVENKWYFHLVAIFIVAFGAWFAFLFIRVKRILENLPTSKTVGVTYGLAEIAGILREENKENLLKGPVSNRECCWYHYLVEERRGSGKNTRWVTIEDRIEKQPFYCEDDEGRLRVFPSKAEIISSHTHKQRVGRYRYTEKRLSPGDPLFVLGKAATDKSRPDSLVIRHEAGSPYIISNKPEKVVMLMKAAKGMGLLSFAVSAVFFVLIMISGEKGQFSSVDYVLASLAGPAFLTLIVIIMMFNDLVFLRQRCDRAWANIQVSLKKRATLIPRLEHIAKATLKHEKRLLEALSELRGRRGRSNTAEEIDHYIEMEYQVLNEINVVVEKYPVLKADTVLQDLQGRMIKLENEIAMIRKGFNDSVELYNTRVTQFPDNLLASGFGFKRIGLLSFNKEVHEIPKVSLSKEDGKI